MDKWENEDWFRIWLELAKNKLPDRDIGYWEVIVDKDKKVKYIFRNPSPQEN